MYPAAASTCNVWPSSSTKVLHASAAPMALSASMQSYEHVSRLRPPQSAQSVPRGQAA